MVRYLLVFICVISSVDGWFYGYRNMYIHYPLSSLRRATYVSTCRVHNLRYSFFPICLNAIVFLNLELQQKESGLQKQVHELISQRTDAALRQHYQEMSDMMEILLIENQRLKEMIREKDSCEIKNSTSEGLSV